MSLRISRKKDRVEGIPPRGLEIQKARGRVSLTLSLSIQHSREFLGLIPPLMKSSEECCHLKPPPLKKNCSEANLGRRVKVMENLKQKVPLTQASVLRLT